MATTTTNTQFPSHRLDANHLLDDQAAPKSFFCEICNRVYIQQASFMRHNKTFHDPSLPIPCSMCECRFASELQLTKHNLRRHKPGNWFLLFMWFFNKITIVLSTDNVFKAFNCKLCNRSFMHRANYIRHRRTLHNPKLPFACKMCKFRFATKQQLVKHRNRHIAGMIYHRNTFIA